MKRELKARQEANIRGLLSLVEVNQVLRAEQLAAPLQPNLVPVPPLVSDLPFTAWYAVSSYPKRCFQAYLAYPAHVSFQSELGMLDGILAGGPWSAHCCCVSSGLGLGLSIFAGCIVHALQTMYLGKSCSPPS